MTADVRSKVPPPLLAMPVTARDHVQGVSGAAVTVVEYGDYQCPSCLQVHPIMLDVQEHMGEQMRLVFRNFPVTRVHPEAQQAAEAAEAAGAQGKFWEMHDFLFEHQAQLVRSELLRHASTLGLNVIRFERDLESRAFAGRVHEDVMSGLRSGVSGTPTFFINGIRHDDPWDLETLTAAIVAAGGWQ